MSLLVQIAAEFTGKKAIKEADTAVGNLTKSTKKLAGALGIALSTTAIIAFGKASVKAFAEAEKANTRLANTVRNLGLSFATANIQGYLDDISRTAGLTGEKLVEAFQPLLTTTGSVLKAQELLNLALEVSAGSTEDLATVTSDLANAYVGNTKGLRKYYLGLTPAELKAASFLEIQQKLAKQFSGSQARYLSTYAGKMQVLGEAAGNAQERIGGALIQSAQDLSGAQNVTDLIAKIDRVTNRAVNAIDFLTWKWKEFWFVTSDRALLENLNPFTTYVKNGLAQIDADKAASVWRRAMAGASGFDSANNSVTGYKKDAAAIKKADADAKKRAADLANLTKKNTAELKKAASLKKAGSIFDQTQIQLIAALKGKLTDEEKLRVQALLAIENQNVAVATQLTAEILKAQDATGNLARFLAALPDARNPFQYLDAYLNGLASKASAIMGGQDPQYNINPATNIQSNYGGAFTDAVRGIGAYAPTGSAPQEIKLTITGDGALTSAIATQLQIGSLSGNQSYIDRRTGSFGG